MDRGGEGRAGEENAGQVPNRRGRGVVPLEYPFFLLLGLPIPLGLRVGTDPGAGHARRRALAVRTCFAVAVMTRAGHAFDRGCLQRAAFMANMSVRGGGGRGSRADETGPRGGGSAVWEQEGESRAARHVREGRRREGNWSGISQNMDSSHDACLLILLLLA